VSAYFDALTQAMDLLAEDPRVVFLGQSIVAGGTAMANTFSKKIRPDQIFEMPVAENMQLGMSIGMSLHNFIPVCCFPRINFLLEATSQLVQHLDKLPIYSDWKPKVIIRTAVASPHPLDPGVQHLGDYSDALRHMFSSILVDKLTRSEDIVDKYRNALTRQKSTLIVEYLSKY